MKKTCSKCNQEKNIADFRKDKSKHDGVQSFCKVCARAHHKSQYTEKYSGSCITRNKRRRDNQMQLLNEYKDSLQCEVCGEAENICLDFHHRDPSTKDFQIGSSIGRSWESIVREIQKCVCICSNCHRKVHAGIIKL